MTDDKIIDEIIGMPIRQRLPFMEKLTKIVKEKTDKDIAIARCDNLLHIAEDVVKHRQDIDHRTAIDVLIRWFAAYKMRKEGFSYYMIGHAIHRDHSTVVHMCKKMKDYFSLPRMYAYEVEKYKEFEERVNEFDKQEEQ